MSCDIPGVVPEIRSSAAPSKMRGFFAALRMTSVWVCCEKTTPLQFFVFGDLCGEVAFAAHAEVAADEGLEVAVEDFVDVADFDAGAEVFGHAVGLQDVAADLRAELDVELGVFELAADGLFLFELVLVEAGAQHLHRLLFVLVLGALVLAAGDEAGGDVGDADGGVGGVDVLAALAAGAVGVDAEVVGLDVDDDGVVDFGRDEDAGEAGVAALGGVEGRDADEAMDAGFSAEEGRRRSRR